MRMRKKKNGEKRMLACADYRIETPEEYKGKWKSEIAKGKDLYLEIGCGKGTFITELAKRHPENFYVAIEVVPDVIMLAMEKAKREELDNVMFVCFNANMLCDVRPTASNIFSAIRQRLSVTRVSVTSRGVKDVR